MKKDKALTSAKEAVKSTEETSEAAINIASDVVAKENFEKTINVVKGTAKKVKSRATKKTTSKKTVVAFYVQYQGKEVSNQTILEKVHEEWLKSHKLSEIKTIDIYFKVEEDTAYCLVNGEISIELKLS